MKVTISSPAHWENLFKYVRDLLRNHTVNVTFEPVKRYKTKKQLGFIFGAIISNLQVYYFDCHGVKYSADDIKDMLYLEVGQYEERQYPNGKSCNACITLSRMDTKQASEFINSVLNWIDNETECILSPDVRYCWVHNITESDLLNAQRDLPERSNPYLAYLRKSHCIHCGVFPSEPHHIRAGKYAGTAKKSPDWFSIPVCRDCHELAGQNEGLLINNLRHILCNLSIEQFCRLCFDRWYNKRF